MQCPHCGQPQRGVCLNCDRHYFQAGVTIHNDGVVAALKERKELADKSNAEVKKLARQIGRLRFIVAMMLAAAILYLGWGNRDEPEPEKDVEPKNAITRPIPFNSEYLLGPGGHAWGDFPIEERRRVAINVFAECQGCVDESLTISLLDEYNYQMFESGQPYERIDDVLGKSYSFIGPLERGHYFVVLQNTSDMREIVIKVKAGLSYMQDSLSP